jgi:hypothetical protein
MGNHFNFFIRETLSTKSFVQRPTEEAVAGIANQGDLNSLKFDADCS